VKQSRAEKSASFLPKIFSGKSWKSIDEEKTKCLLGNLSPKKEAVL
jgi:hypothetical protein